jgi:uncharacterized protein YpmS
MLPSNHPFKKKLLRLIIFALLIIGILIVVLLLLQQTVEKHYTTQKETSSEWINLYKSPDEEYRFMEKERSLSSIHPTMIPDNLIQQ